MSPAVIPKLAVVALTVVAAGIWIAVATTLRHARPAVSPSQPEALVWGDYVFDSRAALATWLHSRGVTYAAWAAAHPAAAAAAFGEPAPARKRAAANDGTAPAGKTVETAAATLDASGSSTPALLVHRLIVVLLLLIALGCLALGAAPRTFRPRRAAVLLSLAASHRPALIAAAGFIIAGLVIGTGVG